MDNFSIKINPQYVKQTDETELIDGKMHRLHEVQKRMKLDFEQLPEFTIITAPTGTGKSYAFPFPVLNGKKKSIGRRIRGLIVLPTNALINELTESFKKTYAAQGIVVNQITGPELNKHEVRGFERWKKVIEIAQESDIVITNPDLINYAMHGGYHQSSWTHKTGRSIFTAFLQKFAYLVFDEYHLYDEAQIANILTLVKMREYFLPHSAPKKGTFDGTRFLFVSATPEKGLKRYFDSENYDCEEIIEKIVSQKEDARAIHGTLEIEFFNCKNINDLIEKKKTELHEVLPDKKALLILNRLADVQTLTKELKTPFENYIIYQSTGYVAKDENSNEKIKNANLIIATNKAEVGVNYDVEYGIMQPGKFYQNFVQRLGRISRGDLEGKVVIAIDSQFGRLKKQLEAQKSYDYYDFLTIMQRYMRGKQFYEKLIPMYMGEYMWCIENNIRMYQGYDNKLFIRRRMDEEGFFRSKMYGRYKLFNDIDKKINELVKKALYGKSLSSTARNRKRDIEKLKNRASNIFDWYNWWQEYLKTYQTFRDGSMSVKIYDKETKQELEYSLDWILQHKVIEKIEVIQTEPYEIKQYTVGKLKEQDKDIQYIVSTLPHTYFIRNKILSHSDMFELDRVFEKSVNRTYDKVRKGDDILDELQEELCVLVKNLKTTFSRKRLKIEEISSDDSFL